MTFTINFPTGLWWIIPTIITIVLYGWAYFTMRTEKTSYHGGGWGAPLAGALDALSSLFLYGGATIIVLISWIVGLLCR